MGDTVPLAEDTDMASGFLTATQGEDLTLSQRKHLSLQLMESKGLYHLPCTIVNSPSATNLADHIQIVNYAK